MCVLVWGGKDGDEVRKCLSLFYIAVITTMFGQTQLWGGYLHYSLWGHREGNSEQSLKAVNLEAGTETET